MAGSRAERRAARRRGRWAELFCALSLRLRGYRILAQDRRGRRGSGVGEIDLVARRGRLVCFIEVKRRASLAEAAAAISAAQRQRLVRAARVFLAGRPDLADCLLRFDAMLVAPGRWPRHIEDAWREEG